jgi:hypothetical protein
MSTILGLGRKILLVWATFVLPEWYMLYTAAKLNQPPVWDFTKWFTGITLLAVATYLGINLGQKVWVKNNNNDVIEKK